MLILNNRINSHDIPYSIKFAKHIKLVKEIAKAVETGVSTIKKQYNKMKCYEPFILPEKWLSANEKQ